MGLPYLLKRRKARKKKISKNVNYRRGRAFEYNTMKKFFQWPYVKRHFASKGIADIVCIKSLESPEVGSQVVFIQCKYSFRQSAKTALKESDKHALMQYAQDCGAIPVYAYSDSKGHVKLVNLFTVKEFIP